MSEMQENNIHPAEETLDNDIEMTAETEAGAAPEELEPAGEKKAKKKKKNKRSRMPVRLAAILLVIALLFGIVVGYAIGRSREIEKLVAAEKRIEELSLALEESGREEIDVFTDEISAENREALADLSGMGMQDADDGNIFLGEDVLAPADESLQDAAGAEPVVVAEFKGGKLMSDEVSQEYNEQLTSYIFSGYTEDELSSSLLTSVLEEMVRERILESKAQELGVYELSDADRSQIAAQAQAALNEQLSFYKSFVYTDGMTDEENTAAALAFLQETEGVDLENLQADLEANWWLDKLRAAVVKDMQLENQQILDTYNELLSEQRAAFSADPDAFESARQKGEAILYNLSGYRAVKPLIIYFSDVNSADSAVELSAEIAQLEEGSQQLPELQAQLDAIYAPVEEIARQALDQASSGASFDGLIRQYSQNSGMPEGGYYICAESGTWDDALVSAAMAMEKPGDISGIVRMVNGVCILQYVQDVQPGAVAMANVYDEITAEARVRAEEKAFSAQVDAWMVEADAKYYPENMQ